MIDFCRELGFDQTLTTQLGAVWGKSRKYGGGRVNLLLSHLLDTSAVAEQVWDHYLARSLKQELERISGGRGRRFFAWLCGIHDIGKTTPAHQRLDDEGAAAVRNTGLTWNEIKVAGVSWRHDKAGGRLLLTELPAAGWSQEQTGWLWPLVAGHHGAFPGGDALGRRRTARGEPQGVRNGWPTAQRAMLELFTRALGFKDVLDAQPVEVPNRGVQLQLSGFVVMNDWIASDQRHFEGVDDLAAISLEKARGRAARAWTKLALRGGWGSLPLPPEGFFADRFGDPPRASQRLVLQAARDLPAPGLVILEAPMGEGKTKGALGAAEILAARFGLDGVFLGMPTQATCDPMYTQLRDWLRRIDPDLADQVTLLHGKARFNQEWKRLLEETDEDPDRWYAGVNEGEPDEFGMTGHSCERRGPAEWFLGPKRGLLSPFVVGTIDQLLYAATRTRHVMLRAAGLAGKVVILDEVHAADVYMSRFLLEGLRWLGQAGVPVVLLSATLPPAQRADLVNAYLAGAGRQARFRFDGLPEATGYPNVTTAWWDGTGPNARVVDAPQWRPDLPVTVEVLSEKPVKAAPGQDPKQLQAEWSAELVARQLAERLADGGCALVIRNTVLRAQASYAALRKRFGAEVRLIHGRLTAQERADLTDECLKLLGPPGDSAVARPGRLVLVATQVAEQSFDVDADVLVTDLTSMDLLLQRLGRVHRHEGQPRPARFQQPHLLVTGLSFDGDEAPWVEPGTEGIYGRYPLLRTAALVQAAGQAGWSIPSQVPSLVRQVYAGEPGVVPAHWSADERQAFDAWTAKRAERAANAAKFLLTREGQHTARTLEGLHYGGTHGSDQDAVLEAAVRDGEPSVEVVLVRQSPTGYQTLAGRSLGVHGEAAAELLDEVAGALVRLPAQKQLTAAALELRPLDGWRSHPWLKRARALALDDEGRAELGVYRLSYKAAIGLEVEKNLGR